MRVRCVSHLEFSMFMNVLIATRIVKDNDRGESRREIIEIHPDLRRRVQFLCWPIGCRIRMVTFRLRILPFALIRNILTFDRCGICFTFAALFRTHE
jgi:hypothetical protein